MMAGGILALGGWLGTVFPSEAGMINMWGLLLAGAVLYAAWHVKNEK